MEIHGLLRISKTKPRIVQNTRVAQIWGSMERKVLNGVTKFDEAKRRKSNCQSSKRKQKKKSKGDFL